MIQVLKLRDGNYVLHATVPDRATLHEMFVRGLLELDAKLVQSQKPPEVNLSAALALPAPTSPVATSPVANGLELTFGTGLVK